MMSNGAVYILYLLGTLALGFLGGWLVARDRYPLKLTEDLTFYQKPETASSEDEKEIATNYFALGYYFRALDKSYGKDGIYHVYGSSFSSGELIEMGSRFMNSDPGRENYMKNRVPKTPTS